MKTNFQLLATALLLAVPAAYASSGEPITDRGLGLGLSLGFGPLTGLCNLVPQLSQVPGVTFCSKNPSDPAADPQAPRVHGYHLGKGGPIPTMIDMCKALPEGEATQLVPFCASLDNPAQGLSDLCKALKEKAGEFALCASTSDAGAGGQ